MAKYHFKPGFWPSIISLVLLPVLLSLGNWQLNRADEKREILALQEAREALPPYKLHGTPQSVSELQYRQVQVSGYYEPGQTIFIDNKVYQGKVGFQVVNLLKVTGSDIHVLVNRGWVAARQQVRNLPRLSVPAGMIKVSGIAKFNMKDVTSIISENRSGTGWPALVRWIDVAMFERELGYKILPFMILQQNDDQYALIRNWKFVNASPEKHTSYAVQWFALSAALLLIYIFVNLKRIDS